VRSHRGKNDIEQHSGSTTTTAGAIVVATAAPAPAAFVRQALVDHFLDGLDPKTRQEYGRALTGFAAFAAQAYELPPTVKPAEWFLTLDGGQANEAGLRWRTYLQHDCHYAPKTVNQRLSALRSLVKLAKITGRVGWTLDVKNMKAAAIRDTRGTGVDGYRKLLAANRDKYGDSPMGRRNEAPLRLLFELALRGRRSQRSASSLHPLVRDRNLPLFARSTALGTLFPRCSQVVAAVRTDSVTILRLRAAVTSMSFGHNSQHKHNYCASQGRRTQWYFCRFDSPKSTTTPGHNSLIPRPPSDYEITLCNYSLLDSLHIAGNNEDAPARVNKH